MSTLRAQRNKERTRNAILSSAQRNGWALITDQWLEAFTRLQFERGAYRVEVYLTKGAGYVREFSVQRRAGVAPGPVWFHDREVSRFERFKLERLLERLAVPA